MGAGYTLACTSCGNYREILIGGGMLPPDHFRDGILEGRYGLDAKEIMEEHPDWGFFIDQQPFSCSCNYVTNFPVVIFYAGDGRKIKCDRHRCSQCGKTLKANSWGKSICWKCGGRMERYHSMMWD